MKINKDLIISGTNLSLEQIETNTSNLNQLRGSTLLWSNPSPTSSFNNQSINIPALENYNTCIIVWNSAINGSHRYFTLGYKGFSFELQETHVGNGGTDWRRRMCSIQNNTITFDVAYYARNYGNKSAGSVSNDICIPLYIYGLNTIFNL